MTEVYKHSSCSTELLIQAEIVSVFQSDNNKVNSKEGKEVSITDEDILGTGNRVGKHSRVKEPGSCPSFSKDRAACALENDKRRA